MVNTILVVEDDSGLQKYLKELILDNGYSVEIAPDGLIALNSIKRVEPDLVILDLRLPNLSGESVVMEIRKGYPDLPVIILTAKDTVQDKVKGLNLGADDYITKPFIADELLARIKARLRQGGDTGSTLQVGELLLDKKALEVTRSGRKIQLTPKEFNLLEYLMQNKGRTLTRDMILNRVWLYSQDIETRVVDVYMGYLRKKVDLGYDKKLISSIRGFGYMIKD